MRSATLRPDLNPILDEGAPTSTGGLLNATQLCDRLGIDMHLEAPQEVYRHGWGHEGSNAKDIIYTWRLTVNDIYEKPTTFSFDLVDGYSPLIVGLDLKQHSDTINRCKRKHIIFQRPYDTSPRTFYTYLSQDEGNNDRLRLNLIAHKNSTYKSLLGRKGKHIDANAIKKIHRFTHATAKEMKSILTDAGIQDKHIHDICDRVYDSCDICASSGTPSHKKKISLNNVNRAFNDSIQADFVTVYIKGEKFEVLNVIDTGTNYGERVIVPAKNAQIMMNKIEEEWIYHHGAPKFFSADPEFCRSNMQKFLHSHSIELQARPSRSSSKNGKVERNNGLFKNILSRITKETTRASSNTLVARASFLTNMFHGNSILSSFQLARGYSPSILGIPNSRVTTEILNAYKRTSANRAIHRLLKSHDNHLIHPSSLPPGTKIWVYYNTSAQNDPTRWVRATVAEALPHFVKCRRSKKGPPMTVAYEDIRLVPDDQLAEELQTHVLEDILETDILECNNINHGRNKEKPHGEEEVDNTPDVKTSFFSKVSNGNPMMDIGMEAPHGPDDTTDLISDEQRILKKIYLATGGAQLSRNKMECAPQWVLDKAVKEELENSWKDAFLEVSERSIPKNANVISSHVVYKVKCEENNLMRMKARLCPHGNRDKEAGKIRSDSSNAQYEIIRILLSAASIMSLKLGCIDIKSAYMQSGPINRELYVRPPKEYNGQRGILWRLLKLPYGISEAGRQWAKVIETWLLTDGNMERVHGMSQLYVLRNNQSNILMLLAKLTDDLLLAGDLNIMETFSAKIGKRFKLGKVVINSEIKFNGCKISQSMNNDIILSMSDYLEYIKPLNIARARRTTPMTQATNHELTGYRRLAGELTWIGCAVLPQASLIGSIMQQKIPNLSVQDLIEANQTLKELKQLRAFIRYQRPMKKLDHTEIVSFSDAAFNISKHQQYGQTGFLTGIRLCMANEDSTIYHVIDWSSTRQKRVSYSSYGAEILACTEADDRGFYMKQTLTSLYPQKAFEHILNVDSKGLFDTITTLHDGKEYRLRQTVQRIRDSFEAKELNVLRWIQGHVNIADALTKRNTTMHRLLNKILSTGRLVLPNHRSFELNSDVWT